MRGKCAVVVGLLASGLWTAAVAADPAVFSVLSDVGVADGGAGRAAGPHPARGVVVRVDADAFAALAGAAPAERPGRDLPGYGIPLDLPHPSGRLVRCYAATSPVMEPVLQARFPGMRTLIVQTADRTAAGRVEITQRGVTGMLRADDGGAWMIDLWKPGDRTLAVSYWLRDLRLEGAEAGAWMCETVEGLHGEGVHIDAAADSMVVDRGPVGDPVSLRTVRLALACTGEYGLRQCQLLGHTANVADPLASMVTAVSRVNVVYENDIAIHFSLVANNDQLVYVDAATDPYPDSCDGTGGADCSGPYLSVNVNNTNTVIGVANYDIGHLLTRVYGGVAYLSSVCTTGKAGGISGIPRGGDVDAMVFLVMTHELGHQFGATHTFSGTRGRCGNNATLATAWEAGGGSSPMAYPGGCPVGDAPPSDNLVLFADPWLHLGSLEQMRQLFPNRTCPVRTTTANHTPVITSSPGIWTIPPATPFVLSVDAVDSDGDLLTYSWEQFDSGAARPLTGDGSLDNGVGALFRSFPPVSSPMRTFPRMADVLSGVPTPGEQLPTFPDTTRRFRVIVRDGRPSSGGTATSASTTLTVGSQATPFALISPPAPSPSAPVASRPPGANTVTWSVGGSDLSPIGCALVDIRFSYDDGATFPVALGTFPNTGAAAASFPSGVENARVKVSAVGNVFFAVSARFTVEYCAADTNRDHQVTPQDIFDFLAAFFQGDLAADVDRSGAVSVQDIFTFLAAYFAGC